MRKCQKRPIIGQKRPTYMAKEAYIRATRRVQSKSTAFVVPGAEVCINAQIDVKRGLPYDKRDLIHTHKRPTDVRRT